MYGGEKKDDRGWIEPLIPKIKDKLGKGFEEIEYELSVPGDSFFMSSLFFVNVRAKGNVGEDKKSNVSLVVKRPTQLEFLREVLGTDTQFHNEILFYRDYAKDGDHLPRCIYTEEKAPCDSVIILENVTGRGYGICSHKFEPPVEYMLCAMGEIGRFHGKGYVAKEREKEKFFDVVADIRDHRFGTPPNADLTQFVNLMAPWAAEYLRGQGYDKNFCDKAEKFFGNCSENVIAKVTKPVEPLSTLCHGDFTLNNILFKKDESGVKSMLIDFAMIRYGTPVIDLSTLICMYSPSSLKKDKLKSLLERYLEALRNYLAEHDIEDDEKYSYEAIYNDFKNGCLFGFVITSFFLTTVLGKNSSGFDEFTDLDIPESVKRTREDGGDEVAKILADMLLDIKDLGSLDHLL